MIFYCMGCDKNISYSHAPYCVECSDDSDSKAEYYLTEDQLLESIERAWEANR